MSKFRTMLENAIKEAGYNNKAKLEREIYDITNRYTDRMYKDDYWEGYQKIYDALSKAGYEIDSRPANDEFHSNGYNDSMTEKMWNITLTKDGITIYGNIQAYAAGSIKDPLSVYDLTINLW